jgi:hypothetical protein
VPLHGTSAHVCRNNVVRPHRPPWWLPLPFAEFEEKTYEIAACAEFGRRLGHVFSPGQVLESRLGFDAAVSVPEDHVVWGALQVPRPVGVLLPPYWRGGPLPDKMRLPVTPVSLILQFKRPEYLRSGAAAQWKYWGEPYFRFARQTRQQRTLRRLERAVGDSAVVRYAAPAFWRYRDLEAAQLAGKVVERTGFASPSALDRHQVWTYIRPGVQGRANPAGSVAAFPRFEELLLTLRAPTGSLDLVPSDRLDEHLRSVGAAAASVLRSDTRRMVERWIIDVVERVGAAGAERELLLSLAMMSTMLAEVGATWWIVDS